VTRSIGGGTLDLAFIVESGLVNQENAPSVVRDDPGTPAAEDLETVLEPRDFRQRHTRELHDEFSLRRNERGPRKSEIVHWNKRQTK